MTIKKAASTQRELPKMVDEFMEKADQLATQFPGKEIRKGFFSKHGFEEKMKTYLQEKGVVFTIE